MTFVILGVKFVGDDGHIEISFTAAAPAAKVFTLAYPWYTPLGVVITLLVGGLLSLRHKPELPHAEGAAAAKAA